MFLVSHECPAVSDWLEGQEEFPDYFLFSQSRISSMDIKSDHSSEIRIAYTIYSFAVHANLCDTKRQELQYNGA